MKKIIVCGDSYMTPSHILPNTHFAELLRDHYNCELTVYARGGMSNVGICLQIEQAIKDNPDLILYNTTAYDRIEVPLKDDYIDIQNVIYEEKLSYSTHSGEMNKKDPLLISDTIYGMLEMVGKYENVPNIDEIKSSLKGYFNNLYQHAWKEYTDTLCLYATLHKLSQTHIKTLSFTHHADIFIHKFPFVPSSSIVQFDPYRQPENDPGYHTDIETQQKIFKLITHLL